MAALAVSRQQVVVVGASAGGVEALTAFVAGLPADLPAAVLVVLHVPADGRSRLAVILDRAGPLPVASATGGEALRAGQVLTAPADCHLLVHGDHVVVQHGPKENGHRPAVDPLFRSAARWAGPHVVAVVLSGVLDDGAAGAAAVALRGGRVVVQDAEDALFPSMPRAARAAVPEAVVARAADVGALLPGLLAATDGAAVAAPDPDLVLETDMAEMDEGAVSGTASPGTPVSVSCPECHGAMTQVRTGQAVHFRCHVGHAFGPASLLDAQQRASEAAMWTAVASLEERASVHRQLAELVADGPADEHRLAADGVAEQARALRLQLRARSRT